MLPRDTASTIDPVACRAGWRLVAVGRRSAAARQALVVGSASLALAACLGDLPERPQQYTEADAAACADLLDNDRDGAIDCDDSGCSDYCQPIRPETSLSACADGIDNDGDGSADCADPQCTVYPGLCGTEDTAAFCGDGRDNDGDGLIDCRDPQCRGPGHCNGPEDGPTACQDRYDNDQDGLIDCADPGCQALSALCGSEDTSAACGDGLDNDGDGHIDCGDAGCAGIEPCVSLPAEQGPALCGNGRDDDLDGLLDCFDPGCAGSEPCGAETGTARCADGIDNDADTLRDCFDPDCASQPACASGQTRQWLEACSTAPGMGCAAGLACVQLLSGDASRCFPTCDAANPSCQAGAGLCFDRAAGSDLCLPACQQPADCAAFPSAFCVQWADGYGAFCYPSFSHGLFDPCDAARPCDPDLSGFALVCGAVPLVDSRNAVCTLGCAGQDPAFCPIMLSSYLWCIDGEYCGNQACSPPWADPSSCGEAGASCVPASAGGLCLHGGPAQVGEACSIYLPSGDPYLDPLCDTNLRCSFADPAAAFQGGLCLQACESDGAPACDALLLGQATSCLYEALGPAPWQGLCGLPCSGTLVYDTETGATISWTPVVACATAELPSCYLIEAEETSPGTLTITTGVCGP